mgnify:CR=1 FL=1
MSEEKRMPVLTDQKKQIFYTGLVYLLVCFMTAGVEGPRPMWLPISNSTL